jgi:arginyl-tRNA synthetase
VADPADILASRLSAAIGAALGPEWADTDPVVRRSAQERFGDYQANAAMGLGKQLGRPPREVAEAIVAHADLTGVCSAAEVAGPGFINLTLEDGFLGDLLTTLVGDERLGVAPARPARSFLVDYGGPNVAKELHVGHLRSLAIGDAIARVLGFLGHNVARQDHQGDWGRQFGMLIEHLLDIGWTPEASSLGDLNELYREAQQKFDSDEAFAERSRRRVVALQGGDPTSVRLWEGLVAESERHIQAVYRRLGVTLGAGDARPESFYNDQLEDMVEELTSKELVRIDDGALCAFPPGFTGRDGRPQPLIVRNSHGGYGYIATDLAAVRHAVRQMDAEVLVYVTDARQAQHFAMVFAVSAQAGWLGGGTTAEHAPFGSILGPDGRPFRTRAGDTVKLADLLDEAVARARDVVGNKNPELGPDGAERVAEAVGIGSVKYNDLSNDRVKDYVFDWDRMLANEGNTAPYLQYARARIGSIFRRGDVTVQPGTTVQPTEPQERALALRLLGFEAAVRETAEHLQPHRLCTFLFDLASTFTSFYEACPVLRAPPGQRDSRLALCSLTGVTLARGLELLGIDAPDRM